MNISHVVTIKSDSPALHSLLKSTGQEQIADEGIKVYGDFDNCSALITLLKVKGIEAEHSFARVTDEMELKILTLKSFGS